MFTAHLFLRCSQRDAAHGGQVPFRHACPPPTAPGPAPLQKSVLVCSAGKRVLWPPHPRHGLSQPVKTLLSWLKANLILQTSAALGLFHNGQACWERLPGRGGGRVCVCGCGRVHACARACMGSVCARVRGTAPVASAPLCACAHLRFAWTRVGGDPASSTGAQLRRGTGVFPGLLHLRPSPAPAEARGPNPGAKPLSATAAPQTAMGTLNLQQSGAPTAGSWFSAWKNSRRIVKP